jgi:CheY-like chemotaxis protein
MLGSEVKYQVWSCPKCPQPAASDGRAPRVLLAEDNTIDQINIRRLLENEGIEVCCVDSGREAVDEARRRDFNMILMDILMPEMDGFEATRLIRDEEEQDAGHGVPIFALTAYSLKAIQDKCRSVGMNGYLSKPVSAKDLRTICSLFYIVPAEEEVSFTATGTELPILDAEDALANLGGVHALYYELLDMFVSKAPNLITGILNHIHAGDADGEKGPLQSLIASADNIGARRMAHLCRYIQSSLDNGNLDDSKEWSEQLPLQRELLLDKIATLRRDNAC